MISAVTTMGISLYFSIQEKRMRREYLKSLQQKYDAGDYDEELLNDMIYDLDLSNHSIVVFHNTLQ